MIEDSEELGLRETKTSYYAFIFCPKPSAVELNYEPIENCTIYTQYLSEKRIVLYNLVPRESLGDTLFKINVLLHYTCSSSPGQPIYIGFENSSIMLYDASHYTGSKSTCMLYYLFPVLCTISPQPLQHFQISMTILNEYSAYTMELAKYLVHSNSNMIGFLSQFDDENPPSLIVGIFIVSKLLSEFTVTYKVSRYLISRLKHYLHFVYSSVIFVETDFLPIRYHPLIKNLYTFVHRNCGPAFAGFLIWSFCSPIIDIDTIHYLCPVSDIVNDADLNMANTDLITYLIKNCSKGQPLLFTALVSSITSLSILKIQSKTTKMANQWTELDFKSVDINQIASIFNQRLKTSSIDFSSQNFFLATKPILSHFPDFPSCFLIPDCCIPFRHLPNFVVNFDVSRDLVFELAMSSIDGEENVSNLFISTLGNIFVLIDGEKWLLLFEKFFTRIRPVSYSIGAQLREQCQKTIWKTLSENSDELAEITNRVLKSDICSLYAGYFSANAFPENEVISSALQQCLINELPKIDLSPRSLGKEFINILAIMRCEWALSVDPVSMRKISKSVLKLVRSIRKRIGNLNHTASSRLECLEKCALHIQDSLNTTFPHV